MSALGRTLAQAGSNNSNMQIEHKQTSKLLTPAGGYLTGYSHTLNPYAGCAYACSYCYVRRMPVALFRGSEWGEWVDVKTNAVERYKRELVSAKKKGAVRIFMSSSTDPYQAAEYKERITRKLLEAMADDPPDFLFVQTRSPLVERDIDVLLRLRDRVRVSMTIETDLKEVRREMTPYAPPIAARLNALRRLTEAGLTTQAAVSPVLPSSERFGELLSGATRSLCIDDYFMGDGSRGKRTAQLPVKEIYVRNGWDDWYSPDAYQRVLDRVRPYFEPGRIAISQAGFMPQPPRP